MTCKEREAVRRCAQWLAYCVEIGWSRNDLDFLESLWWKYHDKTGELVSAAR